MKRAFIVIFALLVIVPVAIVVVRSTAPAASSLHGERANRPADPMRKDPTCGQTVRHADGPMAKPAATQRSVSPRSAPNASSSSARAKAAIVSLFAVKPGEMPPELPELTFEERNMIPRIIAHELTDADGCDAAAVRKEFRLYMEFGGIHDDFLPAYRRKLVKRAGH